MTAKTRHRIVTDDLAQIITAQLPWAKLDGKTVVVTGAAGLIASYLVEALLYRNETGAGAPTRVIATARNMEAARQRFAFYVGRADLDVVAHDAAQPLPFEDHVDYIVHAAGQATPSYFGRDPIGTYLPNVMGMHHLLERAFRDGTSGALFLSSGAIHGALHADAPVLDETVYGVVDPLDPRASYAESKRMGETICRSWFTQHGVPVRMARIGHTYGPGMRRSDERAFAQFVFSALDGRDIVLNSDGSAVRSYSYLADTTTALLMLLLTGKDGDAYLVANPRATCTIRELADLVGTLAPSGTVSVTRAIDALPANYIPNRDPTRPIDIAKMRALGWKPRTGLREGFLRTIESYG